tara:strand:+ start:270 stop:380 length:111 start_codon:yes stop_codon:yes gene_type:complete
MDGKIQSQLGFSSKATAMIFEGSSKSSTMNLWSQPE